MLSKKEKARRYDFIIRFAQDIKRAPEEYKWNNSTLQTFLKDNHIICKSYQTQRTYKPPYCKFTYTSPKKVYRLLAHIRNAFAHGYVETKKKNIILKDFYLKQQTLDMSIPKHLLWSFIEVLENAK